VPTGTVTFLLTDIEGSAAAWERNLSRMAQVLVRHDEILDTALGDHGGIRPLEQGEGDSLVAVFTNASDAVAAALDAQCALTDEDWPEGSEIAVRMALHTGEAQLGTGRRYVGLTIIRCARLRGLAWGGQVLISETAAAAHRLPHGATLLPLGLHPLRGLQQPELVFQLRHPTIAVDFPPLRSDTRADKVRSSAFVGPRLGRNPAPSCAAAIGERRR
jgi:class 3 adenylate cyclase